MGRLAIVNDLEAIVSRVGVLIGLDLVPMHVDVALELGILVKHKERRESSKARNGGIANGEEGQANGDLVNHPNARAGQERDPDKTQNTYIFRLEVVKMRSRKYTVSHLPRVVSLSLFAEVSRKVGFGDSIQRTGSRSISTHDRAVVVELRRIGIGDGHAFSKHARAIAVGLGGASEGRCRGRKGRRTRGSGRP